MLTRPQAASQKSSKPETSPASPVTLSKLWLAGIGAWGHRWTTHFGDLPVDDTGALTLAGNLWAQGQAGFNADQLLAALGKFVEQGDDWPPNLPMLRAACCGIPSLNAVRLELRDRDAQRTGFTRLVWGYLDSYQLGRADTEKHDRMIRDAYDLARENVLAGRESIPEESPAIAAPVVETVKAENVPPAESSIEEARRVLFGADGKTAAAGPDA